MLFPVAKVAFEGLLLPLLSFFKPRQNYENPQHYHLFCKWITLHFCMPISTFSTFFRVWRITPMPRPWWARTLPILRHGLFDLVPDSHRWQLERHNERHFAGRMRRRRRLFAKLLRVPLFCAFVLRRLCPDGPIRFGQRRGRRFDEASGGIAQTGTSLALVAALVAASSFLTYYRRLLQHECATRVVLLILKKGLSGPFSAIIGRRLCCSPLVLVLFGKHHAFKVTATFWKNLFNACSCLRHLCILCIDV